MRDSDAGYRSCRESVSAIAVECHGILCAVHREGRWRKQSRLQGEHGHGKRRAHACGIRHHNLLGARRHRGRHKRIDLCGADIGDECRLAADSHGCAVKRGWRVDAVEVRAAPAACVRGEIGAVNLDEAPCRDCENPPKALALTTPPGLMAGAW